MSLSNVISVREERFYLDLLDNEDQEYRSDSLADRRDFNDDDEEQYMILRATSSSNGTSGGNDLLPLSQDMI